MDQQMEDLLQRLQSDLGAASPASENDRRAALDRFRRGMAAARSAARPESLSTSATNSRLSTADEASEIEPAAAPPLPPRRPWRIAVSYGSLLALRPLSALLSWKGCALVVAVSTALLAATGDALHKALRRRVRRFEFTI
ncbi:hypothetical protein H632_c1613p0 [Helicosporidium sp. ATCC 50920]|nr:hypothetical protein H632_c1613p0 [Helicosporidium sp. ATCC 50920]|eukprot:KDD74056.1 hypothetical protein H632_c1613p0 [Helicosporidium sp. ATCC 50920]